MLGCLAVEVLRSQLILQDAARVKLMVSYVGKELYPPSFTILILQRAIAKTRSGGKTFVLYNLDLQNVDV